MSALPPVTTGVSTSTQTGRYIPAELKFVATGVRANFCQLCKIVLKKHRYIPACVILGNSQREKE